MLLDFLLRQGSPLVDRLQRLDGQVIAPLLFRQPLGHRLPDYPALAPVNALGNLIHLRDEILWQLGSNYTSVVGHLVHQFAKIKSNNIQYEPILINQQGLPNFDIQLLIYVAE